MRVAFCISILNAGGAERCLAELVARIDRRRFEPMVYCLAPRPANGEPSVVPRLEAAGAPIYYLNATGRAQFPRVLRELATQWRKDRPDIVQTFLFHANMVGRIAAWRAGVGTVVSGIRVAERRRRWYLWAERLTASMVDRHVCVSQAVADFSRIVGGLPADRLVRIPNGIDLGEYSNVFAADLSDLGVPPGRRAVVCVGRLDEQKRADWLVRHSPTWMAALPLHDLLLVGDGPSRQDIAQQAVQLGIGDRVHMPGWRSDVPRILAASDLLVLPSAWEGMPNVVLEAMASRLPVVATDVEGVRELLGEQSEAQTVRVDDGKALARRIASILSNPLTAQELGSLNRARVEVEFNLIDAVRAYESLYESLAR